MTTAKQTRREEQAERWAAMAAAGWERDCNGEVIGWREAVSSVYRRLRVNGRWYPELPDKAQDCLLDVLHGVSNGLPIRLAVWRAIRNAKDGRRPVMLTERTSHESWEHEPNSRWYQGIPVPGASQASLGYSYGLVSTVGATIDPQNNPYRSRKGFGVFAGFEHIRCEKISRGKWIADSADGQAVASGRTAREAAQAVVDQLAQLVACD